MSQASIVPFVSFEPLGLPEGNHWLAVWGHKMGPLRRPCNGSVCHALLHHGRPVAVTTSTLIRPSVGGGLANLTRQNTVELSRLCAERPGLCRLWREFVFPALGYNFAISYQDAELHSGQTYRFDGWQRAAFSRAGGRDRRSGAMGRDKWVWVWPGIKA